jgi:hypothetical protein
MSLAWRRELPPQLGLAPDLALDRALVLVQARAALSGPVRAREAERGPWLAYILPKRPVWAPEPALRQRAHKGEAKAPGKDQLAARIRETPAQMRELVQVLGPEHVTDLVEAELGRWPGLTRADVAAMVHARFHGTWWAWPSPED